MPHRSPTWLAARLLAIAAFATPGAAFACYCGNIDRESHFDAAKHVFVATLTTFSEPNLLAGLADLVNVDGLPYDEKRRGYEIGFDVVHVIKGDPSSLPHLRTGLGNGDCGMRVVPGDLLLVVTDDTGYFQTCSLSMPLTGGYCDEIHVLDRMKRRAKDGATPLLSNCELPGYDPGIQPEARDLVLAGVLPWEASPDDCPLPQPDADYQRLFCGDGAGTFKHDGAE